MVAAHELKTPLAVLRQLALALDGLDAPNEHLRSEMVQVSERAMRQVNDLAKIRRLEEGLFEMEPVAVREVCDAVTQELRYLYREQNRRLKVSYRSRAKLVTANRELLYSVIYNFLVNALHYAYDGSQAELAIREKAGRVRVSVRDFGPSLPTEIWQTMRSGGAERPQATAMRPGSSGLGLYIASRFSRYMHAEVGAVRHRDGSSFYVELPISQQGRLFA